MVELQRIRQYERREAKETLRFERGPCQDTVRAAREFDRPVTLRKGRGPQNRWSALAPGFNLAPLHVSTQSAQNRHRLFGDLEEIGIFNLLEREPIFLKCRDDEAGTFPFIRRHVGKTANAFFQVRHGDRGVSAHALKDGYIVAC